MPLLDGRLLVEWWTEEFDAVVVGNRSEYDSAWVPPIPGLKEWAEAFPGEIHHSRDYRRPETFKGKVCLVHTTLSAVHVHSSRPLNYRVERSYSGRIILWLWNRQ